MDNGVFNNENWAEWLCLLNRIIRRYLKLIIKWINWLIIKNAYSKKITKINFKKELPLRKLMNKIKLKLTNTN